MLGETFSNKNIKEVETRQRKCDGQRKCDEEEEAFGKCENWLSSILGCRKEW